MDDTVVRLIAHEVIRAEEEYGPFASAHEALGVLLEEFGELAEALRRHDLDAVRREATQVSAVAARLARHCHENNLAFRRRSKL